jgi:hypothetical protein
VTGAGSCRPTIVAGLVLAVFVLAPGAARAVGPPPAPIEPGEGLEDGGLEPSDVRCAPRLPKLEEEYERSPAPELLYEIGVCEEEVGDYVRALTSLKRYVDTAGGTITDPRRAEVASALARLEPKVARLTVSSDVGGVEVRVDGLCAIDATSYEPICVSRDTERSVLVNPGERRLSVSHAGYRGIVHVLTVGAGEKVRVSVRATRGEAPENPYRDPMWTSWGVAGGAAVAGAILGVRTGLAGDGFGTPTGIAAIALGAGTVIAAGVAAYFTIKSSRWKPPTDLANLCDLRVRF